VWHHNPEDRIIDVVAYLLRERTVKPAEVTVTE
jgi:hypothetical protein